MRYGCQIKRGFGHPSVAGLNLDFATSWQDGFGNTKLSEL